MVYFNDDSQNIAEMLNAIGVTDLEALFSDIPKDLLLKRDLALDSALSEWELKDYFHDLALENTYLTKNFKGAGSYQHHVPALVKYISSRGEFLTSYTPYQPEVSQGTLRAIYMFQSFIADICGMDLANASMYDAATALAESICMAHRLDKKRKIYIHKFIHPEYIEVCENYLESLGLEFKIFTDLSEVEDFAILSIANPNFYGECLTDIELEAINAEVKRRNLFLIISSSEPFTLFTQKKMASIGAQIVCGSAQSFGNPVFYGGAQVGFISSKLEHVRQMPGRIVGKTIDRRGNSGYALTFQAREQHIKRDRASSNICTNQSIHALSVAVYLSLLGVKGIRELVLDNFLKAELAKALLGEVKGCNVNSQNTFNEFVLSLDKALISESLLSLLDNYAVDLDKFQNLKIKNLIKDSLLGAKNYLVCLTEIHSLKDIYNFINQLRAILNEQALKFTDLEDRYKALKLEFSSVGKGFTKLKYLEIANYKFPQMTELEVCRYFTRLSQKNFSIDTNFYPLGSCTMKYNPKINDEIASHSAWTNAHPYESDANLQGLLKIYEELNKSLTEITGFDAFSLQPAAGAQGEFSALLMAKKYFQDKGLSQRNIVLVPDSAHGTNPASAVMAGFKVITVKSAEDGDVDLAHLEALCEANSENIAVFMLTNPNTLGIFSKQIEKISSLVHQYGGLMYYDGANLNAIVGVSRPGDMGFDLIHLNVHKTFSTPHGGGGPGAGPVGAKGALVDYLPSPYLKRDSSAKLFWATDNPKSIGRVRSFYGNFNVLIRALAYIKSNGREGISQIGRMATLNANYLQERIRNSKILSEGGLFVPYFNSVCKHEFIISASKLKEKYDISALDIAKALLDRGIHAPTIYFPINVNECIMIEPTETESKESLDSLVTALEEIISLAKIDSSRELIKNSPQLTALSRFDEVKAVKEPVLSWMMEDLSEGANGK